MKKLTLKEHKTITLEYNEDYLVDIVITPDEFEAWLYKKGYAIKDMMFGVCRQQVGYEETLENFIDMVESNLICQNYIEHYEEDYVMC